MQSERGKFEILAWIEHEQALCTVPHASSTAAGQIRYRGESCLWRAISKLCASPIDFSCRAEDGAAMDVDSEDDKPLKVRKRNTSAYFCT
jgi:hypothetical protein